MNEKPGAAAAALAAVAGRLAQLQAQLGSDHCQLRG
jgi:hypothetical protein